jgi:WD40 repeat protein
VPSGSFRGEFRNYVFFVLDRTGLITLVGERIQDRKALVLDLASGQVRSSLGSGNPHGIKNCAVSPDGKTLAVSTYPDIAVQLWDIATGKLLRTLPDGPMDVRGVKSSSLAFSPDGKMLAR